MNGLAGWAPVIMNAEVSKIILSHGKRKRRKRRPEELSKLSNLVIGRNFL